MLCVAFLKSGPGGAERKVVIKCIPKPQNIYNHRKIIWQTCGMSEKVQVEVGNCFDKLFNPLQLRIVLYILCFIYCIGNRTGTENIMQSHGKQRIREVLQTEAWRIMTISPPPLVFSELIISRTTLILQYIFGLVF